jgi:hypothetical protein
MINLAINIRNPYSNRFENIKCWSGDTPIKNKFWEVQIYKSSDVLDFGLNISHRQSHAGIRLCLGLFGYNIEVQIYDNRHWDTEKDQWEIY